jgi:hypothetical protein
MLPAYCAQEQVLVVGYPRDGDNTSITSTWCLS